MCFCHHLGYYRAYLGAVGVANFDASTAAFACASSSVATVRDARNAAIWNCLAAPRQHKLDLKFRSGCRTTLPDRPTFGLCKLLTNEFTT